MTATAGYGGERSLVISSHAVFAPKTYLVHTVVVASAAG